MNSEHFERVMQRRFGQTFYVLGNKAKEYARGDRLHNFKEAAKFLRTTPEKACLGFLTKHLISVVDMVFDLDEGKIHDPKVWDEKLGDSMNYLILLEGLLVERHFNMISQAPVESPEVSAGRPAGSRSAPGRGRKRGR